MTEQFPFMISGELSDLSQRPTPTWAYICIPLVVLVGQMCVLSVITRSSINDLSAPADAYNTFYPVARSLLENGTLNTPDGSLIRLHPPGFPIILAAALTVGEPLGLDQRQVARCLNVLLCAAAAIGVFLIARRLLTWPFAAIAAIGFGLYPPLIWLSRDAYNEPAFLFLFVFGITLALRAATLSSIPTMILAVTPLAAATLTRTVGLFVPFVLCAAYWMMGGIREKGAARPWLIALPLYVLLLVPWSFAISSNLGKFVPITDSFEWGHVRGLCRYMENDPVTQRAARFFDEHPHTRASILQFHREAIAEMPIPYVWRYCKFAFVSFFGNLSRFPNPLLVMLNTPLIFLTAITLWLRTRRQQLGLHWGVLIALMLYFWATSSIVWASVRYMVPIMWVLFIGAAGLLQWFTTRTMSREPSRESVPSEHLKAAPR